MAWSIEPAWFAGKIQSFLSNGLHFCRNDMPRNKTSAGLFTNFLSIAILFRVVQSAHAIPANMNVPKLFHELIFIGSQIFFSLSGHRDSRDQRWLPLLQDCDCRLFVVVHLPEEDSNLKWQFAFPYAYSIPINYAKDLAAPLAADQAGYSIHANQPH